MEDLILLSGHRNMVAIGDYRCLSLYHHMSVLMKELAYRKIHLNKHILIQFNNFPTVGHRGGAGSR